MGLRELGLGHPIGLGHAEGAARGADDAAERLVLVLLPALREHEREISMVKTTESVYRATRSISDTIGSTGSRLLDARQSLERIKQRHEDLADRMQAAESLDKELGEKALEAKLAEAGIGANADRGRKALERIKARRAAAEVPEPGTAE